MERLTAGDNVPVSQGRRNFLKNLALGGVIFAAPVFVTGCKSEKRTAPPIETPLGADIGKQRLIKELDKLPDSVVKSLLQARIKPLFGQNPPSSLNYDGLDIKLSRSAVVLKNLNANSVSGHFTPRDSSTTKLEPLFPTKNSTLRLPYRGLMLDTEKQNFPPRNLDTDGNLLIDVEFPIDKPFYEGLSPVITVVAPDPAVLVENNRQIYKNLERLVLVKEACTFLLVDIFISEAVRKMHEAGFDITIEAKDRSGKIRQGEALIQSLALANNALGRIAAAIDLGGYLLAFKAVEGTEIDPEKLDESFAMARSSMKAVELGTLPKDVLYNSFHWAITDPDASQQLHHVGNINKIP